jgi:hypothetical protein
MQSRNEALKLVEQRDTIAVAPMNPEDATSLFEKMLEKHVDGDSVSDLAAALEYMLLAIYFPKSTSMFSAAISQRVSEERSREGESFR